MSIELEFVFTSLLSLYVSVVVFVWHNPLARCLDEGIYAEVCTLFCPRKSVPCEVSVNVLTDSTSVRACLLVTVRLT